jgi:hypothetical protein
MTRMKSDEEREDLVFRRALLVFFPGMSRLFFFDPSPSALSADDDPPSDA